MFIGRGARGSALRQEGHVILGAHNGLFLCPLRCFFFVSTVTLMTTWQLLTVFSVQPDTHLAA